MRRALRAALVAATLAAGAAVATAADEAFRYLPDVPRFDTPKLSAEAFARWHAKIHPGAEKWADIPWETDLQAARQRAARERKPLLMWIMDGHPLGCT